VITKVEVLGFNGNENEMKYLADFISLGIIFTVDNIIADKTIELRKLYAIKLPDAIIAATALGFNLTLLTRNTKDFKRFTGLTVIDPYTL
jgi:predicted nucleic acid-binding protein